MSEPHFVSETRCDPRHAMNWTSEEVQAMKEKGATFFRASVHPDDKLHFLVEGWISRPDDYGEPRFSQTKGNKT